MGNYFLSMNLGIGASLAAVRFLIRKRDISRSLIIASSLAYASFMFLAFVPVAASPWWRMAGLFGIGCGAGLLNTGVFQAVSRLYQRDRTATLNLAGVLFGLGCVLIPVLIAGTFYAYTVQSILILVALIPAGFIVLYARSRFSLETPAGESSWRRALADFKTPTAVLFTLLLFFQFGNEWSIAGWLPLFLMQRLGISAESSLLMLALYWLALQVGRVAVFWLLPAVSHGKLLMGSVAAALFGCTILSSTDNRFGAVAGILLVGGGFASVYPLVAEKIRGRFPYYHPGFFNGIFSFALTGGLLAPWSLGFFADMWGIRVVMALPLLGTLMVFVLLLLIWAEAKLKALA